MVYDELSRRLTGGMTPREIFEYTFHSISSAKDICVIDWTDGLFVSPKDYNPRRIYIKNHIPRALKLNQRTLVDKILEILKM